MDKKDFFDRFIKSLENTKDKYNLANPHDALILWFGENCLLLDADEMPERIVKDTYAEGIDAILVDESNYKLLFIQAQTVNDFSHSGNNFPESDLKSTLEGVRFLLRGDYKGKITPNLENLVDEYHELDRTGDYKTVVLFLILKQKPVDYKFAENFKKDFPSVEVDFYDFDWLFDFYTNKYLTMRAAAPEKISFKILTDMLAKNTPYKSRVFTCKGEELARIYNDYKERVFQQNVRYSLGLRSRSINRQILDTAIDDERGKDFWYFNNGVTIVCKKITQATSGKVINLENAQIINGAQTTYALYEAYKDGNLEDDVEVLVKVTETGDKDFIDNVTLYTNSQNAIRLRDLCSNDQVQLTIQKILLDSYQYFYERKRGEFDSLYPTPPAKKGVLGSRYKVKVVSNENAAQSFLAMYLDKPAQAKSEKKRIFVKDKTGFYDDIFNAKDSILAEKMLMSWKLLKYIEEQKEEYSRKYRAAENLSNGEKIKIYRYDFLLHAEYFILNIFKDFLKHRGFDINTEKDDLQKIILEIDSSDDQIREDYETITETLATYMDSLKGQLGYYHNKFFKNEQSIGLIRNSFKHDKKHSFVEGV